jgi:hypothetical protein
MAYPKTKCQEKYLELTEIRDVRSGHLYSSHNIIIEGNKHDLDRLDM